MCIKLGLGGTSMLLDISTLYLVATMMAAMLGGMLLFFGRQESIPALKWWGTAYLLGAASVALWTLASDTLGPLLSLAVNAVGFVACGMVWNASRVFHGRGPNLPGLVLGAIAWVAAAVTLAPARTAGSNSGDRKGSTSRPSELVPSGKTSTANPSRKACSICRLASATCRLRPRSTKMVPPSLARVPRSGHRRTSDLATKTNGRTAP